MVFLESADLVCILEVLITTDINVADHHRVIDGIQKVPQDLGAEVKFVVLHTDASLGIRLCCKVPRHDLPWVHKHLMQPCIVLDTLTPSVAAWMPSNGESDAIAWNFKVADQMVPECWAMESQVPDNDSYISMMEEAAIGQFHSR